jgi:hypothetical protein
MNSQEEDRTEISQIQNETSELPEFQNGGAYVNDTESRLSTFKEISQISMNYNMENSAHGRVLGSNSLSPQLPIQEALVCSSQLQESLINSYIIYKIKYVWHEKDFEILRRFSDFVALRKAISNILPFSFIFPVHKKKLLVGS